MNAPLALDTQGSMPLRDSRFTVPGMRCAGCISKIERGLAKLEGVDAARVNLSAKRVAVRHHARLGEDDLIEAIAAIGFEAQSVADNPMARDDRESVALMRALAVAGFGMMNIMLLSVSVWSGAEGVTRDLFHWLSAMIACRWWPMPAGPSSRALQWHCATDAPTWTCRSPSGSCWRRA